MEAKFTRGPWKEGDYILWPAHGGDAQFPVHAPKRGRIALALKRQADARLIAAAPELVKALTKLMQHFPTDDDMQAAGWSESDVNEACDAYEAARAALSKALGLEGEQG